MRRAAILSVAGPLLVAPTAFGQTTSNPYPTALAKGDILVNATTVAALPNSPGTSSRARANSAAVSPDGRFFALDQRGTVYAVGGTTPTPYFNLSTYNLGLLNDDGERGFSQVAFHPQFDQPGTPGYGKLYASFSTSNTTPAPDFTTGQGRTHDEVVYEFTTATPLATTFTQTAGVAPRQVLRLAQPATNHNGGGLGFNPYATAGTADFGALYYSSGDGGGGGDPYGQGQNPTTPFASILRIDPMGTNGTGGDHGIVAANAFAADGIANTLAEVYAYGFRNPQRFSFDRPTAQGGTGRLLAGDVGQGTIEEVDAVVNGGNFGWSAREGSFAYASGNTVSTPANFNDPAFVRPVAEYDHGEGSAISGGFVYRGTSIAELVGKYVFGDLVNGRVFYIDGAQPLGGGQDVVRELRLTDDFGATQQSLLQMVNDSGTTTSRVDLRLGQDAAGELYLLNKQDGLVRRLSAVPEPAAASVLLATAALLGRRRHRS